MLAACMARAGGMGALVDPDPGRAARAAARMSSSAARAGFPGKAVQCVLDFLFKHREMVSRLVELGVAQEAAPVEFKEKRKKGKRMRRRKPREG